MSCFFPVFLAFKYRLVLNDYRFMCNFFLLSLLTLFWVSLNFLSLGYDSCHYSCVPKFHLLWDSDADLFVKSFVFSCWKTPCKSKALLFTNLAPGSSECHNQNAKRPTNLPSIPIHFQGLKLAKQSSRMWRQEN